jgi:hypothetical protein
VQTLIRYDTVAIIDAVNHKRLMLGMSWPQAAEAIGLRRCEHMQIGDLAAVHFKTLTLMVAWLGKSLEDFVMTPPFFDFRTSLH